MKARRIARVAAAWLWLAPGGALAYPGGTPDYQTDVAPYCAACHSSRSEDELRGAPGDRAKKELAANKHLALIEAGDPDSGYASLSKADRALLVKQIQALDAASQLKLEAPATVTPGEVFKVTVTLNGGGGPVSGIGLVDGDHRWYARPIASAAWQVAEPPVIRGPGGKLQTEWLAKRPESAGRNLSYVNVTGIQSDAAAQKWADAQVIFTLRAPSAPGRHPLAAVYLYGTELASPLGYTVDPKDPLKRKQIRGGFTGGSGRVVFTPVQQIEVAP